MSAHTPLALRPGAEPADEFRRLARAFAGEAVAGLDRAAADDPHGVQDARRWLKRLRGLLRLYEHPLGAAFAGCDAQVRSVGRALGPLRDAEALHETLAHLAAVVPPALAGDAARLAAALEARAGRPAPGAAAPLLAGARAAVGALAARLADASPGPIGPADLRAGLEATYRRGRRRCKQAREAPAPAVLHALRRHAGFHRQHLRLLAAAWPPALAARAGEAGRLHDLLGLDRDLAALTARIGRDPVDASGAQDLASLLAFVERHRDAARADALALARRMFAEKPAEHGRRLAAYWRAAGG